MTRFQLREKDIEFIKTHEGCKLVAYRDSKGIPTIGYGHTEGVSMGMSISTREAEEFLKKDLRRTENAVNRLGVAKTANQYAALVSFAFNVGVANLTTSTLLKKIKLNRPTTEIQDEFMRWVYITKGSGENKKKTKLKGLEERRRKEATLWALI